MILGNFMFIFSIFLQLSQKSFFAYHAILSNNLFTYKSDFIYCSFRFPILISWFAFIQLTFQVLKLRVLSNNDIEDLLLNLPWILSCVNFC